MKLKLSTLPNTFRFCLSKVSLSSALALTLCLSTVAVSGVTFADDYVIDTKKAHASIQFKISHLGFSWLWGRFDDFEGTFSYDEKDTAASKVAVTVKTASVNSNHAERDKHLRSDDFLDVKKYPEARFVSTSYIQGDDGNAKLTGQLTLHGISKEITINVSPVGAGKDPWGGYRRGFEGTTRIALADYGIKKNLGPASAELDLILEVEGVRK